MLLPGFFVGALSSVACHLVNPQKYLFYRHNFCRLSGVILVIKRLFIQFDLICSKQFMVKALLQAKRGSDKAIV